MVVEPLGMAPPPTVIHLYPFGMEMFPKSKDFIIPCSLSPMVRSEVWDTMEMDPWGMEPPPIRPVRSS